MKTLAFVVYVITSPAEFAGEEFVTIEPVPCAQHIDATIPFFEAHGISLDAYCIYTHAPETSPRPKPRPTQ